MTYGSKPCDDRHQSIEKEMATMKRSIEALEGQQSKTMVDNALNTEFREDAKELFMSINKKVMGTLIIQLLSGGGLIAGLLSILERLK